MDQLVSHTGQKDHSPLIHNLTAILLAGEKSTQLLKSSNITPTWGFQSIRGGSGLWRHKVVTIMAQCYLMCVHQRRSSFPSVILTPYSTEMSCKALIVGTLDSAATVKVTPPPLLLRPVRYGLVDVLPGTVPQGLRKYLPDGGPDAQDTFRGG